MKKIQSHPRYREIKDEARRLINKFFNRVPLEAARLVARDEGYRLEERIVRPSAKEAFLEDPYRFKDYVFDFAEFELPYEASREEIEAEAERLFEEPSEEFIEWFSEDFTPDPPEIANSTLYETTELRRKIEEDPELFQRHSFGLIDSTGCLGPMLFHTGGGYSFLNDDWIPLFLEMNWIRPDVPNDSERLRAAEEAMREINNPTAKALLHLIENPGDKTIADL